MSYEIEEFITDAIDKKLFLDCDRRKMANPPIGGLARQEVVSLGMVPLHQC